MSTTPVPTLPIAVPGSRGAYGQKAARTFFGASAPVLPCTNSRDAVRAVVESRASHAVLAIENSITGAFEGVADALFEGDVSVVGEVLLPIRHALIAAPGARLEDLSVVTGHPASLSQCRDRIASWGLASRATADCAVEANALATAGETGLGLIGSRELAEAYGLAILAEGLSDQPDNRTRFLVVCPSEVGAVSFGSRYAIQVGPVQTPRALKTLRIQLESLGASRVRVPLLGSEDGRRFVIEFDHREGAGSQTADAACGTLPHRFLGAWQPSRVAG